MNEPSRGAERSANDPGAWDIDSIVKQLRRVRLADMAVRERLDRPAKLPSRKVLAAVLDGLSSALFPNRLGVRDLTIDSVDYYVGLTLDQALRSLADQVRYELQFSSTTRQSVAEHESAANAMVGRFARRLPRIRQLLQTDIAAAYSGDPAANSMDEVLVCYPGILAMIYHRVAHELYRLGAVLVARIIAQISHSLTGIEIHPGARIGASFFIDHGTGVVIGETSVIGARVRVYHGVTLGSLRTPSDDERAPRTRIPRHPIVEDDVVIYSNASLLGRIRIGRGSVIGGNICLTTSVPAGSVLNQSPQPTNCVPALDRAV